MKQLTCEMCGSIDLLKQDGVFICQTCGTKYSVEEAKKLMIEGVVEVKGTVSIDRKEELQSILNRIEQLLRQGDRFEADKFIKRALEIDMLCAEAYLYRFMMFKNYKCIDDFDFEKAGIWDNIDRSEIDNNLKSFLELSLDEELKEKVKKNINYDSRIIIFKCRDGAYRLKTIYCDDNDKTEIIIPAFVSRYDERVIEALCQVKQLGIKLSVHKDNKNFYTDEQGVLIYKPQYSNFETIVFAPSNITTYKIAEDVKDIAPYAFWKCEELESVDINEGLGCIKEHAFEGCYKLKRIKIPAEICIENENAFDPSVIVERTFDSNDRINSGVCALWSGEIEAAKKYFEIEISQMPNEPAGYIGKAMAIFDKNIEKRDEISQLLTEASTKSISEKMEYIVEECTGWLERMMEYFCELYDFHIVKILIEMGIEPTEECLEIITTPAKDHLQSARNIARLLLDKGAEVKENIYNADIDPEIEKMILEKYPNAKKVQATEDKESTATSSGGCYVATSVYGSYDCPQVWTLRRYRDNTLASTWYGRAFIHTYYAISPSLVKWFGHTDWFKKMWQGKLDKMVEKLQNEGVESTPYEDKTW